MAVAPLPSLTQSIPNGADGILTNEWVRGYQNKTVLNGLGDRNPVKGVAAEPGQFGHLQCGGFVDGQRFHQRIALEPAHEFFGRHGKGEFSQWLPGCLPVSLSDFGMNLVRFDASQLHHSSPLPNFSQLLLTPPDNYLILDL